MYRRCDGHDTNLMGVSPHGNAKCTSQAKIGEFQIVMFVDEQILRLEITMQDSVRVTIKETRS